MLYAAYVCQPDGDYHDLEAVIEAISPHEAARRAFELAGIHPDDEFPQILIVQDADVHVFTRDDKGCAVTWDADLPRQIRRGPASAIVYVDQLEQDRRRE